MIAFVSFSDTKPVNIKYMYRQHACARHAGRYASLTSLLKLNFGICRCYQMAVVFHQVHKAEEYNDKHKQGIASHCRFLLRQI